MFFGLVLILLGILGFFMNSPLLGMFEVNTIHNWVHLLFGVVAIGMSMQGESGAKLYAKIFGLVYGLVTILGLVNGGNIFGLFHTNGADNVLHLLLTLIFLWVGFRSTNLSSGSSMNVGM